MKETQTLPINQVRPRLTEILDMVRRAPVTVTKDGSPVLVMLDPGDYASLMATMEMLSNPDLRSRLDDYNVRKARGELEWVSHEEVERLAGG
jgi:antitoxin YefM